MLICRDILNIFILFAEISRCYEVRSSRYRRATAKTLTSIEGIVKYYILWNISSMQNLYNNYDNINFTTNFCINLHDRLLLNVHMPGFLRSALGVPWKWKRLHTLQPSWTIHFKPAG